MKLFDIELTNEEFDKLMCEQSQGKELKVVDGKVVAVEHEITEEELINNEISTLTEQLQKTDYIDNKLTEAIAEYIATGDNTNVLALRELYKVELQNRASWRLEINKLENTLKN